MLMAMSQLLSILIAHDHPYTQNEVVFPSIKFSQLIIISSLIHVYCHLSCKSMHIYTKVDAMLQNHFLFPHPYFLAYNITSTRECVAGAVTVLVTVLNELPLTRRYRNYTQGKDVEVGRWHIMYDLFMLSLSSILSRLEVRDGL